METVLYAFRFNWLDCVWWLIPLTLSANLAAASAGIRKNRPPSGGGKAAGVIIAVLTLFLIVVTILWIGLSVVTYHVMKAQIAAEAYREVTGPVEEFSPMPWSGHRQETFEIAGVAFSYSAFSIVPGYHTPSSWGGVITHDGQLLKIRYTGAGEHKTILYIAEIADQQRGVP